jgi:hypothetical protein
MPLRQAQGRLSRQPAGPFGFAQGRPPALQSFFRSLLRCETVLILGGVDGDEEKSSPPGQNYFWSESGAAPGAWPWA